eukprot:TRINITY_DN6192_c0_g1_i1.p1 TRINITY_DN6192_c0_g1~~TRINITY_DN6192_c0_g1_i1.p1  ORF type:complete len:196 (+),score=20.29 TRINITY_DN6192_c0_g1_i1:208-795(+)
MQERQQNYRQQQNYQDRGMQWNQQQWNNGQQHYNNNSNYNSNSNQQSSFGQFGGNRFNKKYNSVPVPEDNLSQAAKNWNVYSGKEESERDWCGRAGRELKTMQKQLSEYLQEKRGVDKTPVIKKEQIARYVRKVRARLTEVKQKYRLDGPDQMWVGQTDKEYLVVVLELARDIQRFTQETLETTGNNMQSSSMIN